MSSLALALLLSASAPTKIDTASKRWTAHTDSAPRDTVVRSGTRAQEPLHSFRAKQVPLSQALQLFAKANDLSIESDALATNPVNVDFRDLPLDRALSSLLGPHGLAWERNGRSVKVLGASGSRLFKIDYLRLRRGGSGSSQASISSAGSGEAGRMTVSTSDDLLFWDELESQLAKLLTESGKLVANRTSGTLWVKDAPANLAEIDRYLSSVTEAAGRQVELTARIYEVELDDEHSLGIDWSRVHGSADLDLSSIGAGTTSAVGHAATNSIQSGASLKPATLSADFSLGGSLDLVLSALKEQGDVRSVSQPRIVTLNNQPALIKIGTDMPYFVSTVTNNGTAGTTIAEEVRIITVGVVLSVTPQISADGRIQLGIEPLISSLVGTATSRYGSTAPIIDMKQSSSIATLRDRETVRLSGLIQESTYKTSRKVPLLGDIPLLGAFFRWNYEKTSNRELVIFVTPRILD